MPSETSWDAPSPTWTRDMATRPGPSYPPPPMSVEQQIATQGQWIQWQHAEILRLRARVNSLERPRRFLAKAWSVFWNDPVKYVIAGIGLLAWLTGKMTLDQVMHFLGAGSAPGP